MNASPSHWIEFLTSQSLHLAVLFVLIALLTLLVRKQSAHLRYLLWLVVLVKCLVPPLWTIPMAILPQQAEPAVATPQPIAMSEMPQETPVTMSPLSEPTTLTPMSEFEVNPPVSQDLVPETAPIEETPVLPSSSPAWFERIEREQGVLLLWLAGTAVLLLITLYRVLHFGRWIRRMRRGLDESLLGDIESLGSGFEPPLRVQVYTLDGISQPFVWGLWRGSIYVPANFEQTGSANKRASVLLHEMAHVRRMDPLVNLIQILVQAVYWFHPLVWVANRLIRAEREKCCDEIAIAKLKTTPKDYGSAIVETLVQEYQSRHAVPTLAVAGPVKNLEDRIKTIMKPGKRFYTRPSFKALLVTLLLAVVAVPTTVAFTQRHAHNETDVSVERPDENFTPGEVLALSESQWTSLYLPEIHESPVALTLDSHQLIRFYDKDPVVHSQIVKKMEKTPERSYLLYSYSDPNDKGLLIVNDLRFFGIVPDTGYRPIIQVIKEQFPDQFTMVAPDGQVFEIIVEQADSKGCRLECQLVSHTNSETLSNLHAVVESDDTKMDDDPKTVDVSNRISSHINRINFGGDLTLHEGLRMLAAMYKVNIIPSDKVQGQVPVRDLYDVNLYEALEAILGNYKYVDDGTFIRVYTAEEYDALPSERKSSVSNEITPMTKGEARQKLYNLFMASGMLCQSIQEALKADDFETALALCQQVDQHVKEGLPLADQVVEGALFKALATQFDLWKQAIERRDKDTALRIGEMLNQMGGNIAPQVEKMAQSAETENRQMKSQPSDDSKWSSIYLPCSRDLRLLVCWALDAHELLQIPDPNTLSQWPDEMLKMPVRKYLSYSYSEHAQQQKKLTYMNGSQFLKPKSISMNGFETWSINDSLPNHVTIEDSDGFTYVIIVDKADTQGCYLRYRKFDELDEDVIESLSQSQSLDFELSMEQLTLDLGQSTASASRVERLTQENKVVATQTATTSTPMEISASDRQALERLIQLYSRVMYGNETQHIEQIFRFENEQQKARILAWSEAQGTSSRIDNPAPSYVGRIEAVNDDEVMVSALCPIQGSYIPQSIPCTLTDQGWRVAMNWDSMIEQQQQVRELGGEAFGRLQVQRQLDLWERVHGDELDRLVENTRSDLQRRIDMLHYAQQKGLPILSVVDPIAMQSELDQRAHWTPQAIQREMVYQLRSQLGLVEKFGKLEFRIVPFSVESSQGDGLDADEEQRYRESLRQNGPIAQPAGDGYVWMPLRPETNVHGLLITEQHQGQTYILASNQPSQVILPDGSWGLAAVYSMEDNMGRPAIGIEFDETGGQKMRQMSRENIKQPLAVVLDDQVLSAPTIMTTIGKHVQITGSFSEAEVREMIIALQKGMGMFGERNVEDVDETSHLTDKDFSQVKADEYSVLSSERESQMVTLQGDRVGASSLDANAVQVKVSAQLVLFPDRGTLETCLRQAGDLPDAVKGILSAEGQGKARTVGGTMSMSDDYVRPLMKLVRENSEVYVMSAPSVLVPCGKQAELFVGQQIISGVPAAGQSPFGGVKIYVLPQELLPDNECLLKVGVKIANVTEVNQENLPKTSRQTAESTVILGPNDTFLLPGGQLTYRSLSIAQADPNATASLLILVKCEPVQ